MTKYISLIFLLCSEII